MLEGLAGGALFEFEAYLMLTDWYCLGIFVSPGPKGASVPPSTYPLPLLTRTVHKNFPLRVACSISQVDQCGDYDGGVDPA